MKLLLYLAGGASRQRRLAWRRCHLADSHQAEKLSEADVLKLVELAIDDQAIIAD